MQIVELPDRLRGDAVALWHEVGLTRPWNDPHSDLRRALDGAASTVVAAVDDDGSLSGTAMVGHDGHRGWIYYLAVAPARQHHGTGRALVAACEDWVRGLGVPKMQLMVRTTNSAVVGFYEALGYADQECVVLGRFLDR